jgi:hypothetical protein
MGLPLRGGWGLRGMVVSQARRIRGFLTMQGDQAERYVVLPLAGFVCGDVH